VDLGGTHGSRDRLSMAGAVGALERPPQALCVLFPTYPGGHSPPWEFIRSLRYTLVSLANSLA